MTTENNLNLNEENSNNEKLQKSKKDTLNTNIENDIIKDESVEQTQSDHVDEIKTHENLGHRDPAHKPPENNADQDATNQLTQKEYYKTFETKKELSDFVAKKLKNKAGESLQLKSELTNLKQENLDLQKKVEQLRNVEAKSFYKSSAKTEVPETINERVKGLL